MLLWVVLYVSYMSLFVSCVAYFVYVIIYDTPPTQTPLKEMLGVGGLCWGGCGVVFHLRRCVIYVDYLVNCVAYVICVVVCVVVCFAR